MKITKGYQNEVLVTVDIHLPKDVNSFGSSIQSYLIFSLIAVIHLLLMTLTKYVKTCSQIENFLCVVNRYSNIVSCIVYIMTSLKKNKIRVASNNFTSKKGCALLNIP